MIKGESVSRSSELTPKEALPQVQRHLVNLEEALYFFAFTNCYVEDFISPNRHFNHIASLLSPLVDTLRHIEWKIFQLDKDGMAE